MESQDSPKQLRLKRVLHFAPANGFTKLQPRSLPFSSTHSSMNTGSLGLKRKLPNLDWFEEDSRASSRKSVVISAPPQALIDSSLKLPSTSTALYAHLLSTQPPQAWNPAIDLPISNFISKNASSSTSDSARTSLPSNSLYDQEQKNSEKISNSIATAKAKKSSAARRWNIMNEAEYEAGGRIIAGFLLKFLPNPNSTNEIRPVVPLALRRTEPEVRAIYDRWLASDPGDFHFVKVTFPIFLKLYSIVPEWMLKFDQSLPTTMSHIDWDILHNVREKETQYTYLHQIRVTRPVAIRIYEILLQIIKSDGAATENGRHSCLKEYVSALSTMIRNGWKKGEESMEKVVAKYAGWGATFIDGSNARPRALDHFWSVKDSTHSLFKLVLNAHRSVAIQLNLPSPPIVYLTILTAATKSQLSNPKLSSTLMMTMESVLAVSVGSQPSLLGCNKTSCGPFAIGNLRIYLKTLRPGTNVTVPDRLPSPRSLALLAAEAADSMRIYLAGDLVRALEEEDKKTGKNTSEQDKEFSDGKVGESAALDKSKLRDEKLYEEEKKLGFYVSKYVKRVFNPDEVQKRGSARAIKKAPGTGTNCQVTGAISKESLTKDGWIGIAAQLEAREKQFSTAELGVYKVNINAQINESNDEISDAEKAKKQCNLFTCIEELVNGFPITLTVLPQNLEKKNKSITFAIFYFDRSNLKIQRIEITGSYFDLSKHQLKAGTYGFRMKMNDWGELELSGVLRRYQGRGEKLGQCMWQPAEGRGEGWSFLDSLWQDYLK